MRATIPDVVSRRGTVRSVDDRAGSDESSDERTVEDRPVASAPAGGVDAGTVTRGPDAGGFSQAFRGLSSLRVPSFRSVLVTAFSLAALLSASTAFLVGFDAVLARVLSGPRLPFAGVFGAAGLLTAGLALSLLLATALDGPTEPRTYLERRPRRVVGGLLLLVVAAACALAWASGAAVR